MNYINAKSVKMSGKCMHFYETFGSIQKTQKSKLIMNLANPIS